MAFRTHTNFDLALLSLGLFSAKLIGAFLPQPHHQHTDRIHVLWLSEPKHNLTWIYFPSA